MQTSVVHALCRVMSDLMKFAVDTLSVLCVQDRFEMREYRDATDLFGMPTGTVYPTRDAEVCACVRTHV
jgi:hypothetical protein